MSPGWNHSAIQASLAAEILICNERKYRPLTELSLSIGGVEHRPDISVYEWFDLDTLSDRTKVEDLPLLAIEIVSPSQGITDIFSSKGKVYLDAGIKSVWFIEPFTKAVLTFQKDKSEFKHFLNGEIIDFIGIKARHDQIF